jgi:hypothetical protein
MLNLVQITNNNYWQSPAITELHAYEKIKNIATAKEHQNFEYIAFPWATLIDFLQIGKVVPDVLLEEYRSIKNRASRSNTVVTVCQHIYCYRYLNIFKEVGVTDIFWSHAKFSDTTDPTVKIHAFPLYPVIIPEDDFDVNLKRDILYSFIGAYDPKYYQTDVRRRIFDSVDDSVNRVIVERKEWHYNAHVYKSQIDGKNIDAQIVKDLESREIEYRDLLSRSIFSLCPSGSGPNSIRLWESLAYGSIPVIFKDNICLPGNFSEWQNAALFFTETQSGVDECIKMLPSLADNEKLLREMRAAGADLYKKYGRENFIHDINHLVTGYINSEKETSIVDLKKDKVLIVLDPGLKDSGSHHHQINSDMFDSFKHRTEIFVLANEKVKISADMTYEAYPCFSYSVYDFKYSDISKINQQAIRFARDISLGLDKVNRVGVVYIHTCTLPLLMGLSFVIGEIFNKIDGVYLELMFLPFGYESVNPNEKDNSLLDYLYVQAIERISNKLKEHGKFFSIATSNAQFRSTYTQMFVKKNNHQIEIDIHPHVMLNNNSLAVKTSKPKLNLFDGVNALLHAGDPRPGKGLSWIKNNISKLINSAPKNVNFYCHINEIRFPKDYPQVVSDVKWIENFSVENPRLIILRDRISSDEWFDFLSKFDYFIIPNEVSHYKNKTSGVVMDAVYSLESAERVFVFKETLIYKIMHDENFRVSMIEDIYSMLSTFTPRSQGGNLEIINSSKIFKEPHAAYAGRQLRLV